MTHLFPILVALMETGAAVVYAAHGDASRALLWAGYALAAWILVGL